MSIFAKLRLSAAVAAVMLPTSGLAQDQRSTTGNQGPHLAKPEAERIQPDPAQLLDRLFARLNKAEDAEEAKVIERAIWTVWLRSGSPTADALVKQAQGAIDANQLDTAKTILDTVVDLNPDYAEGWNRRATLFFMMRDFKRSLADIARVLELEPRHFGALAGLGMIRQQQGDEKAALSAFRRALAIHPNLSNAKRAVKKLEPELEQKI